MILILLSLHGNSCFNQFAVKIKMIYSGLTYICNLCIDLNIRTCTVCIHLVWKKEISIYRTSADMTHDLNVNNLYELFHSGVVL